MLLMLSFEICTCNDNKKMFLKIRIWHGNSKYCLCHNLLKKPPNVLMLDSIITLKNGMPPVTFFKDITLRKSQ